MYWQQLLSQTNRIWAVVDCLVVQALAARGAIVVQATVAATVQVQAITVLVILVLVIQDQVAVVINMKVIKLDRRYAHSRKFSYAIQFPKPRPRRASLHIAYYKAFERVYGKEKRHNPECKSLSIFSRDYYIWNEDWYYDSKHFRICFKNESDVTAVMLMIDKN